MTDTERQAREVLAEVAGFDPAHRGREDAFLKFIVAQEDGLTIDLAIRAMIAFAKQQIAENANCPPQAPQETEAEVEAVAAALWGRVDDRSWHDPRIGMLERDEWRSLARAALSVMQRPVDGGERNG